MSGNQTVKFLFAHLAVIAYKLYSIPYINQTPAGTASSTKYSLLFFVNPWNCLYTFHWPSR